jgi:hypothetical protein
MVDKSTTAGLPEPQGSAEVDPAAPPDALVEPPVPTLVVPSLLLVPVTPPVLVVTLPVPAFVPGQPSRYWLYVGVQLPKMVASV